LNASESDVDARLPAGVTPGEEQFETYLEEFPLLKRCAYLNTASEGILPLRSLGAAVDYLKARRTEGRGGPEGDRLLERGLRSSLAALIGADEDEVALSVNTSFGINLAALAAARKPGVNVLLAAGEFPANVYPWLNLRERGLEIRFVERREGPPGRADFEKHMDRKTAAVAISFVDFKNGGRADLAELASLCHANGSVLVVDGTQGVGVVPLEVHDLQIDFLACGGPKWLLSPKGTGFLYCARRAREFIGHPLVGWTRMKGQDPDYYRLLDYRYSPVEDASGLEVGTLPLAAYAAMRESVDLLLALGRDSIWKRVEALRGLIVEGLKRLAVEVVSPEDPAAGSGIVSFRARDPLALTRALEREGIKVSAREGVVRTSVHFYNREEDVERLLAALERLGEAA